jgi:hypothetical protein
LAALQCEYVQIVADAARNQKVLTVVRGICVRDLKNLSLHCGIAADVEDKYILVRVPRQIYERLAYREIRKSVRPGFSSISADPGVAVGVRC